MPEDMFGHMPQKFENACVLPLMLAEGFVIHKEVDDITAAVDVR